MVDHTEIFAVENICAVLIFFHGEILARPGLFHHGILKPACLDAFTPVGLAFPVCKIIGQKTAAAPGNTERPMAEYFQFDIHPFSDIRHF